jgi:hypothetical protein
MNGGTTQGGRTQDDVFKKKPMGKKSSGPAHSKSCGAYKKSGSTKSAGSKKGY